MKGLDLSGGLVVWWSGGNYWVQRPGGVLTSLIRGGLWLYILYLYIRT
jgi:hypothetical protein